LSKIRRLADLVAADLFCICDPDLTVDETACRAVVQQAIADVQAGEEVVAFGVVEGRDDGTLLSNVIAIDKWLSHRVLRRLLWAAGVGITLPGQFLIVSPGLLRSLAPDVDSYLDDLYLGLVARQRGVCVRRVPVVVAKEDPRSGWLSLLTQRMRWMRGLVCLFRHLFPNPSACGLLGIHFAAYHGLPIVAMIAFLGLTAVNPLAGGCVFLGLAAVLCVVSRQSFLASVAFLGIFPFVHVLATLLWWMPVSRTVLTRR
jgi:cellulose synthase/poly-beta-1,6-N-acetylglucosamine synthase-like glycosyltransferase